MIKLLTYLGPTLLVAGLTKNYLYYNAFNIRILDYIELSETLAIITEVSVFILILIPFSWFVHFMLDVKKEHVTEPEKHKDLIQIAHEREAFFKRFWIYLVRYWGASLMIILLLVFSLLIKFLGVKNGWIFDAILILMISMTTFIVLVLEFRYKFKRIFERELDATIGLILHYGGFFLIAMTFYTYIEVKETKNGMLKHKQYSIELNNGESIKTNKDLIAIGQTRNYFFLFDRLDEKTTVIKKDIINKISIK
jgi:hypothetical protein